MLLRGSYVFVEVEVQIAITRPEINGGNAITRPKVTVPAEKRHRAGGLASCADRDLHWMPPRPLDAGRTASELGLSMGTVKREWTFAKAWLAAALDANDSSIR
jgi:hypothetical protein